jgi:phosphoglycerate dehydrogenase-like enzyme
LIGQSVGIVSYGAISSRLIPKLRLFTDKIKVYSTHEDEELAKREGFTYATLEEIFKTCKIVSVHTAKNPETHHMINRRHFDMLADGALFINTSRGAVIDEQALIDTLKENRFQALLDVYETEPPAADNELRNLDNVTLFPHMAGPTYDMRERITGYLIDDIVRFEKGEKVENEVTKAVAEQMTIA